MHFILHIPSLPKCSATGLLPKESSFKTWSHVFEICGGIIDTAARFFPSVPKLPTVSIVLQFLHPFIFLWSWYYSYQNDGEASTGKLHRQEYFLHREAIAFKIFFCLEKLKNVQKINQIYTYFTSVKNVWHRTSLRNNSLYFTINQPLEENWLLSVTLDFNTENFYIK
jgi:hypothetical protein